jgi:RNA polymerase sigma-70 factor (ECF subfamily)
MNVRAVDLALQSGSRGDRFEQIYASEIRYVWNSLHRLGVPTRDLEDVAHETLLTIYRKLDEYDSGRPLRPWIFGFVYRTAADYRKRAYNRNEIAADENFDTRVDDSPTAEQEVVKQQERALVAKALETLSLEHCAVFVMMEIDGHSAPEVVEALGMPLNTVYSRLRTARADFTAAVRRLSARRGGA